MIDATRQAAAAEARERILDLLDTAHTYSGDPFGQGWQRVGADRLERDGGDGTVIQVTIRVESE